MVVSTSTFDKKLMGNFLDSGIFTDRYNTRQTKTSLILGTFESLLKKLKLNLVSFFSVRWLFCSFTSGVLTTRKPLFSKRDSTSFCVRNKSSHC